VTATSADGLNGPYATLTLTRILRSAWPNCTAKRAARFVGIPFETVSRWLKGRSHPPGDVLLAWAYHRGVRAELQKVLEEIDIAQERLLEEANGQGVLALGDVERPARSVASAPRRSDRPANLAYPLRRAA
jgi:transcriptional regulator with XRE-family HTH domain